MQLKILITGTFSAGKTEFMRSINEIDVSAKITVDEDLVLRLFRTPGQNRFDFMWEILSEGIQGYIMVDSLDPNDWHIVPIVNICLGKVSKFFLEFSGLGSGVHIGIDLFPLRFSIPNI